MKTSELKVLGKHELEGKLAELKKEMMKISAQASVSVPKSPGKIKHMKRTIARIITLINNQPKLAEKGGKQLA